MVGAGNDFIVIDNRFYNFSERERTDLARRLCPRRTGIGADGLLAFDRAKDPAHAYRMRYHNADGSPATMCGNGARCLALFARQAGLPDEAFTFESDAGVCRARFAGGGAVRIYATPPRDFSPKRPLGGGGTAAYVWTGTPHAVCFVADVAHAPVEKEGRRLRHDAAFAPEGANANFAEVVAPGGGEARLRVRTFEKGVETETEACGTGALAAAVVARLTGRLQAERVAVEMPGGTLHVGFRLAGGERVTDLYLEGPAEAVFRGTVEV